MDGLHALRVAENAMINDVPEIMVMREMRQRRPTFVLKRGAYTAPGEPVEPGTPDKIMPYAADLPGTGLAWRAGWWIGATRSPRGWRSTASGARILAGGLSRPEEDFGTKASSRRTRSSWIGWPGALSRAAGI